MKLEFWYRVSYQSKKPADLVVMSGQQAQDLSILYPSIGIIIAHSFAQLKCEFWDWAQVLMLVRKALYLLICVVYLWIYEILNGKTYSILFKWIITMVFKEQYLQFFQCII